MDLIFHSEVEIRRILYRRHAITGPRTRYMKDGCWLDPECCEAFSSPRNSPTHEIPHPRLTPFPFD